MIRRYVAADSDAIVDVWAAASRIATPFLSERFIQEESDTIREIWLHKAETWVFENDGRIVGFISLIDNEVGAIFVDPDAQGRGIGRKLMDHAASLHDELFLDVFEENLIGRRFYERYGFCVDHRHIHEHTGHAQLQLRFKRS